jgi:hypothetical protein
MPTCMMTKTEELTENLMQLLKESNVQYEGTDPIKDAIEIYK